MCLRSLELAITYKCNSACEQCSCRLAYDRDREKKERLTIDEFKNAVDQAVELGAFQFSLNGGEPMLEEETVFELTRYIKKHHKRFVMICTNGTLLDEQKLIKLKECGLDGIEMGLDSAFEQVHDDNRRSGSYDKILENIRNCKKHNIHVSLNTILSNDKVQQDDIIYTLFLAKKLGCLLQITPCCLTGAFKNRLDLMLTEETKLYFFWLLSKTWKSRTDMYSGLTTIKCPAAREKIGLQPYGDIVSCPLIQITYGNIREKSLADIQADMVKNPYYNLKKTQGCLPAMSESFIKEYLVDK
ncbi:radical SAM/SPASM domain-containing protein [Planctomycetota bacterium]